MCSLADCPLPDCLRSPLVTRLSPLASDIIVAQRERSPVVRATAVVLGFVPQGESQ